MGSTWDIGTKYIYVIPQGFGSRICTLTIPTICKIDTVTKVVGKFKEKLSDNSHFITLQIDGQSPNLLSSNYITVEKKVIQLHHQNKL